MEIDSKIIICGIFCLTIIEALLLLLSRDTTLTTSTIIGVIALSIGIVIPMPKIDNKTGVLRW